MLAFKKMVYLLRYLIIIVVFLLAVIKPCSGQKEYINKILPAREYQLPNVFKYLDRLRFHFITPLHQEGVPLLEIKEARNYSKVLLFDSDGKFKKLILPQESSCLQVFPNGRCLAFVGGGMDGYQGVELFDCETGKVLRDFSKEMEFGEGILDEIEGQSDGKRIFITSNNELKIFSDLGSLLSKKPTKITTFNIKESKTAKYIGFETDAGICEVYDENFRLIYSTPVIDVEHHDVFGTRLDFFPCETKAAYVLGGVIYVVDLKNKKILDQFNLPFTPQWNLEIFCLSDNLLCVSDKASIWFKPLDQFGFKKVLFLNGKRHIYKVGKCRNGIAVVYGDDEMTSVSFFADDGIENKLLEYPANIIKAMEYSDGYLLILKKNTPYKLELFDLSKSLKCK